MASLHIKIRREFRCSVVIFVFEDYNICRIRLPESEDNIQNVMMWNIQGMWNPEHVNSGREDSCQRNNENQI